MNFPAWIKPGTAEAVAYRRGWEDARGESTGIGNVYFDDMVICSTPWSDFQLYQKEVETALKKALEREKGNIYEAIARRLLDGKKD